MKWFVHGIFVIAWALWLGGAVATLIFVQRLFHGDHQLAVVVAPQLFLTFEKYQLMLAAVAVITVFGRRRSFAVLLLVLTAAFVAVISALLVTPRIEQLRLAGEQSTAAFRRFHGLSMLIYLTEVLLLGASGFLLARPRADSA